MHIDVLKFFIEFDNSANGLTISINSSNKIDRIYRSGVHKFVYIRFVDEIKSIFNRFAFLPVFPHKNQIIYPNTKIHKKKSDFNTGQYLF